MNFFSFYKVGHNPLDPGLVSDTGQIVKSASQERLNALTFQRISAKLEQGICHT